MSSLEWYYVVILPIATLAFAGIGAWLVRRYA